MKVFFWLPDTSGVAFYRALAPAVALTAQGHRVACDTRLPDEARDGAFDVIVGMRVSNEGASGIWQRLAQAGHTKLVFEIDDDLWHVDPSNKPAIGYYSDPARLRRLTENAAVADVVTVSTPALGAVLEQMNRNVHVLPNQVPASLLGMTRQTADMLTVGWRGGPSHARDFGELAAPMRRWLQHPSQRGRVEFHGMGTDYTDRVTTPRGSGRARHTPWKDTVEGFLRAIDFDVACVPLFPCVFNESKSELALLEMSALGIPCIASAVGPYKQAAVEGAPVVLASTASEWRDALDMFFHPTVGKENRADFAKAARKWVAGRTFESNINLWEKAYQS